MQANLAGSVMIIFFLLLEISLCVESKEVFSTENRAFAQIYSYDELNNATFWKNLHKHNLVKRALTPTHLRIMTFNVRNYFSVQKERGEAIAKVSCLLQMINA